VIFSRRGRFVLATASVTHEAKGNWYAKSGAQRVSGTNLEFDIKINDIPIGRRLQAKFGCKCPVVFINPTANDLSQEIAEAGGDDRRARFGIELNIEIE